MDYKLLLGDCLERLKEIPDNSIHSIVTDPPYGISFMGKKWDYSVPSVDIWKECLRVLKPGGHLLSFSSARTYHRMAINVEDAGFEIRDQIMWVYGSGFPKSHNIGKAIDKKLGNERRVVGNKENSFGRKPGGGDSWDNRIEGSEKSNHNFQITEGSSEWEGWGTATKPAHEPIVLARKPFKGDVASNVLENGTGAINIDDCRVGDNGGTKHIKEVVDKGRSVYKGGINSGAFGEKVEGLGRWPANFIHDGLEEEWSNFFYCAKASKKDRNEGCEESTNDHPTIKPTELMRYLCRLVTPKNGIVLDPFMGSGSTGKAALLENFSFIGIELSEEYLNIAEKRIKNIIT